MNVSKTPDPPDASEQTYPGYNRARADSASSSYPHASQDNHITSNPSVILDMNFLPSLWTLESSSYCWI